MKMLRSILQKAFNNFMDINFVIIGHLKTRSKYSLLKLEEYL